MQPRGMSSVKSRKRTACARRHGGSVRSRSDREVVGAREARVEAVVPLGEPAPVARLRYVAGRAALAFPPSVVPSAEARHRGSGRLRRAQVPGRRVNTTCRERSRRTRSGDDQTEPEAADDHQEDSHHDHAADGDTTHDTLSILIWPRPEPGLGGDLTRSLDAGKSRPGRS
jgi:hypothetical protein